MATFSEAVQNQSVRTTNGMMAYASAGNACVTLFYKIGAMRGKDITKDFVGAYVENPELALRIAAWVRDARGGAGERQIFRNILKYLPKDNSFFNICSMKSCTILTRLGDISFSCNHHSCTNRTTDRPSITEDLCIVSDTNRINNQTIWT